jgi:hypothetical protein
MNLLTEQQFRNNTASWESWEFYADHQREVTNLLRGGATSSPWLFAPIQFWPLR